MNMPGFAADTATYNRGAFFYTHEPVQARIYRPLHHDLRLYTHSTADTLRRRRNIVPLHFNLHVAPGVQNYLLGEE
jgi:hypothetical protein